MMAEQCCSGDQKVTIGGLFSEECCSLNPPVTTAGMLLILQASSSYDTMATDIIKVSKCAKIRNRYNQVPHLTQDTKGKETNS